MATVVRGRPPILNPLTECVRVPVTKSDKVRLMEQAQANGITVAALIRKRILIDERPEPVAA